MRFDSTSYYIILSPWKYIESKFENQLTESVEDANIDYMKLFIRVSSNVFNNEITEETINGIRKLGCLHVLRPSESKDDIKNQFSKFEYDIDMNTHLNGQYSNCGRRIRDFCIPKEPHMRKIIKMEGNAKKKLTKTNTLNACLKSFRIFDDNPDSFGINSYTLNYEPIIEYFNKPNTISLALFNIFHCILAIWWKNKINERYTIYYIHLQ